jgi:hypothetical protein
MGDVGGGLKCFWHVKLVNTVLHFIRRADWQKW